MKTPVNAGRIRSTEMILHISLDYNIQEYAEQAAKKAMEEHGAQSVSVLMMNPQNGEILAMVNVPEFNLNEPFFHRRRSADKSG